MIKETLQAASLEVDYLLTQLTIEVNLLVDTMVLETKRLITRGYSKQKAISLIMNDFNKGENFMSAWSNKQSRMMQLAYKNVVQNTNKSVIKKDEKVKWVLEPGAVHCADCEMMRGEIGTKEELLAFGVGLPGDGMTECSVGCKCMLVKVK